MIKNNAVLATVLFALILTVSTISYIFYELYLINQSKHVDNIFTKHSLINQLYHTYLTKQISEPMFDANLAVYDLDEIKNQSNYKMIVRYGKVLKTDSSADEISENHMSHISLYSVNEHQVIISMLTYEEKIYFWIESPQHSVLLLDRSIEPYNALNLVSAYITVLTMLLISFSLIIYRLYPLRKLRKKIARFGEGHMRVSFKTLGTDEIALIANELDTAQKKIRYLIESRTLFLRNIMHELKTPIAKGRLVASMLQDNKQQERMNSIFKRLESLIGEFALIEEITSYNQHHDKNEYRLIDLVDGAIDMAMVDYEAVNTEISSTVKLIVDYRLFVTAIKNLIDNAIKYSLNQRMKIWIEHDEIIFANEGEPLKKAFAHYIEPFVQDHPGHDGFGLGLYIVDAILKEHGYVLAYERREHLNCFIIVPEGKRRK